MTTRARTRARRTPPPPPGPRGELDAAIAEGSSLPISGWDTSPVRGRWIEPGPPWSYRRRARTLLRSVGTALDLGTGGGELLASLAPLPRRTFATEGYPPNRAIARRRLRPLGVRVLGTGPDRRIPLPDASIELVLDRHESFDAAEVRRVLRPGGTFLTQQVGGANYREIERLFGVPPESPVNQVASARTLAEEIAAAGLTVVERRSARYRSEFRDVGALVWFLRFAPWEAPGFSPVRHREALERVRRTIVRSGAFAVTGRRILVVARRPKEAPAVRPGARTLEKKVSHAFCLTAKHNQVT